MNLIANILTNQWVIGIGSSIIVYFITNFIVSKRKDQLYKQKIEMANSEMLHSLKPMVSSEEKINLEYYDSIAKALSTKHNVEKDDLYSFDFIIDNVITEIMRSQFLSYKQKKNFVIGF